MRIEIAVADHTCIRPILENLREQEKKTIAKLGIDPYTLLDELISSQSPSFVALVDGVPSCIWGLTFVTLIGEARLWMLTTSMIEQHKIFFLRKSKLFVQWARANYGPILGAVDCDFDESRKWLNWIGFKEIHQGPYIFMRYS